MTEPFRDNAQAHQYELEVEGKLARIVYEDAGTVRTFLHTLVPEELAGRGIASRIVQAALNDVRKRGMKVVPQCPFTRSYIEKHPTYQDLVA